MISVDFHGSTGYGQAFTDAINRDWGGKPLEDLQKGLAAALAQPDFAAAKAIYKKGGHSRAMAELTVAPMERQVKGNAIVSGTNATGAPKCSSIWRRAASTSAARAMCRCAKQLTRSSPVGGNFASDSTKQCGVFRYQQYSRRGTAKCCHGKSTSRESVSSPRDKLRCCERVCLLRYLR